MGNHRADIDGFLRKVVLHAPFGETMAADVRWETAYDVEAWADDGYSRPLADWAYGDPRALVGYVEPERKALIQSKVDTFGEHPAGLGKFTRTMFARDLRRTFVPEHSRPAAQV